VKALRAMQAKAAADVPGIELYRENEIWLVNARVQNFQPSILFNGDQLDRVTLKTQ
jgi:hypothetical protein